TRVSSRTSAPTASSLKNRSITAGFTTCSSTAMAKTRRPRRRRFWLRRSDNSKSLRLKEPLFVQAEVVVDSHITNVGRRKRFVAANAELQGLARLELLVDRRSGETDSFATFLIEDGHIGHGHADNAGSKILERNEEAILGWSFNSDRHVWILCQHRLRESNEEYQCD